MKTKNTKRAAGRRPPIRVGDFAAKEQSFAEDLARARACALQATRERMFLEKARDGMLARHVAEDHASLVALDRAIAGHREAMSNLYELEQLGPGAPDWAPPSFADAQNGGA